MKHLCKSIFVTLILCFALNLTFCQDTIHIISGDPVSGKLKLSCAEPYEVDQYTRITWLIDPGSKVASINKIHKKKGAPILFIFGPSRDGNNWTGKVIFAPKKDYDYFITWTEEKSGKSYTYDPKIAVKPSPGVFIALIGFFVMLFTAAFFGVRSFSKKRKLAKGYTKSEV